jgi:hypothetical protein
MATVTKGLARLPRGLNSARMLYNRIPFHDAHGQHICYEEKSTLRIKLSESTTYITATSHRGEKNERYASISNEMLVDKIDFGSISILHPPWIGNLVRRCIVRHERSKQPSCAILLFINESRQAVRNCPLKQRPSGAASHRHPFEPSSRLYSQSRPTPANPTAVGVY